MISHSIRDDLYRYCGNRKFNSFLRYFFFTPGFRYIFFLRKTQNASTRVGRLFWTAWLRQVMLRTGIQIPPETKIDTGFRIGHFGTIVIHPAAVIGKNFNIAQGVTIGYAKGKRHGVPVIGNNVCVSPNAVIVGNVSIGNDVFIAPNTFVNIDVPDGAIAIGSPAKIIQRDKASDTYIAYKV